MSFLKLGICFFGLLTLAPDFRNSFFSTVGVGAGIPKERKNCPLSKYTSPKLTSNCLLEQANTTKIMSAEWSSCFHFAWCVF